MTSDRSSAPGMRQLFVSRSLGLCELVKCYQVEQYASADELDQEFVDFMTLEGFVSHMEATVSSKKGPSSQTFSKKNRVDFRYFRDDIFPLISDKVTCKLVMIKES